MFEQVFKNIDDVIWKEAGCTTELDYTEQTSWLLFLKLDGLKQDLADEAVLEGKKYSYILDKLCRWESWAAPTLRHASGQARKIWYYQLDPGRNLGKTNPLNDADLAEFVKLQKTFADSPKSWSIDASTLSGANGFDLSVKNPNGGEEVTHRSPQEIMDEIAALDAESAEVLGNIKRFLSLVKGELL